MNIIIIIDLKKIIYQPELSNILFYQPNKNNYSIIICRTIWNKLYKKYVNKDNKLYRKGIS